MEKYKDLFKSKTYWIFVIIITLWVLWANWIFYPEEIKWILISDSIFSGLVWVTGVGTVIYLIKKLRKKREK